MYSRGLVNYQRGLLSARGSAGCLADMEPRKDVTSDYAVFISIQNITSTTNDNGTRCYCDSDKSNLKAADYSA